VVVQVMTIGPMRAAGVIPGLIASLAAGARDQRWSGPSAELFGRPLYSRESKLRRPLTAIGRTPELARPNGSPAVSRY
jgi:hypothetical protein